MNIHIPSNRRIFNDALREQMRKRVVLPNRLTFPFLSSDLLFPFLLPRPQVLTFCPASCTHIMPWVLPKARFQVFTSRPSVLTFRQGLRYLIPGLLLFDRLKRYCTHLQARPIVLTSLPRVLTSRPDFLTSRQKLRYSPPGQASCTNLQARRYIQLQASSLVLTS